MNLLGVEGRVRSPVPAGWPSCRQCGCWEYGVCFDEEVGACWWVEEDLCSFCAGPEGGMILLTELVPGGILETDYVHLDTYDETCSRCRRGIGEDAPLVLWLPPDERRMLVYCEGCHLLGGEGCNE